MACATGEWVDANDNRLRAIDLLRQSDWRDKSFLVERKFSRLGCTCHAGELTLDVFTATALRIMLTNPDKYHVVRYTIIIT